jgi:hypothetical protein
MLHADDLITALDNTHDISFSLGQRMIASVTTPYTVVNIRFEGMVRLDTDGMTLNKDKFEHLVHIRAQIERVF